MPDDDPTEIIQRMLNEFELCSPVVELLTSTDHCNAKIVTESDSYFLKVLASGTTEAQLHSRLQFADFLREGGLPIPALVETWNGRRFATTSIADEKRLGVLSRWIDGETLDDRSEANWRESAELPLRTSSRAIGSCHLMTARQARSLARYFETMVFTTKAAGQNHRHSAHGVADSECNL
jgi:Ser/Thr protein kinase RdoA (MazF antagonist)